MEKNMCCDSCEDCDCMKNPCCNGTCMCCKKHEEKELTKEYLLEKKEKLQKKMEWVDEELAKMEKK